MRLHDFVQVEFARAWQEERGASVVDPRIVEQVAADPEFAELQDDERRLVVYFDRLLAERVSEEDGAGSIRALQGGLKLAHWVAPLLGLLAGAALLEASLPPNDVRPVNVFVFVAEGIVLPSVFLLGTMLLALRGGKLAARLHPVVWLMSWLQGKALRTRVGALSGRVLRRSGVSAALFASLSHLLWIGALAALLATATWRFAFDDYLFSWSSTMPVTAQGVERLFDVLAAPVGWLPGVDAPSAEQVEVSQYASLEGSWPRSSGDPVRDDALRKGWYGMLLAVVAFWGLLPRIAALVWARLRIRTGIRRALGSSSNRAVLAALASSATTTQVGGPRESALDDALPPRRADGGSARPGQGLDVVAFATAAPGPTTLQALKLDRLGLTGEVHDVPDDDDDAAMEATLARLAAPDRAPGGAVVVFDVAATPGRLRERFLRDLVDTLGPDCPVHVLLTGVARFRSSPRGRAFAARLEAWVGLAGRAGVASALVHLDDEEAGS